MATERGLALIVGAGPGLGLAIAKAFGTAGHDLALVLREGDNPAPYRAALDRLPVASSFHACDAGHLPFLEKLLKEVQEADRPAGVLVYNPSRGTPGPPSALTPRDLLSDLGVNAAGALCAARSVAPAMRERGRGTILFTGGGSALHPKAAEASLGLGKGALRTLSFLLAEELEPEGIHVATVTIDGFVKAGTALDPDRIAQLYLQLHGEPRGSWRRELVVNGLE
jgi:short-subunit dehydrogenase